MKYHLKPKYQNPTINFWLAALWVFILFMLLGAVFCLGGCTGTTVVCIGGNCEVTNQINNVDGATLAAVAKEIGLTEPGGQGSIPKSTGASAPSGIAAGSRWWAMFNQVTGVKRSDAKATNSTPISLTGVPVP